MEIEGAAAACLSQHTQPLNVLKGVGNQAEVSLIVKVLLCFLLTGEVLMLSNQIHNRMPTHHFLHNQVVYCQHLIYIHTVGVVEKRVVR